MKRIILVAAIEDNGKFLFTKQGKGGRQEGLWGFSGGNLEKNETDLISALKREVKEETGLEIKVEGLIGTYIEVIKDIQLIFFYFKATKIGKEAKTSEEIAEFKWLTLDDIENFPKNLIRPPYSWIEHMVKALKQNKPVTNILF